MKINIESDSIDKTLRMTLTFAFNLTSVLKFWPFDKLVSPSIILTVFHHVYHLYSIFLSTLNNLY